MRPTPRLHGPRGDEERWRRCIIDALIEAAISRDNPLLIRDDKPAFLHRLFHPASEYSGQPQDADNTTTLAQA